MGSVYKLEREFDFNDLHFSKVKGDLYDYAGIVLSDHKKDMAYNRLVRRLRALKLSSFDKYFQYIEENPQEFTQFINALTTNLTAFFRECHHFEFVKSRVIPALMSSPSQKIRIWSAGCSNGEEAYSIAMTLLDVIENIDDFDIKILATDIDSSMLDSAQKGIYDVDRIKNMDTQAIQKHFLQGVGEQSGKVQIKPNIQKLIHFKHLNLMSNWPMQGTFDFIFCRNVMIYFNRATQQQLISKLASYLKEDGYLFVGHSEALAHHQSDFELIGKTIYQKKINK